MILHLGLILALLDCSICALPLIRPLKVLSSMLRASRGTEVPWWTSSDLNFGCTGCGKCCQNDGEVWLDTNEIMDLSNYMGKSCDTILDEYTSEIRLGWAKLKNKPADGGDASGRKGQCVFLDENGKCGIYKMRPVQCRTYPWWPRLLSNESTWLAEAVVPDDVLGGKHWNPETAGCEGINHANATTVSVAHVHRSKEVYDSYSESFPIFEDKDVSQAKERLLVKADLVSAITKSTKAWVEKFVIKYNLCPFADNVFKDETVRYRTYLGNSDSPEAIEQIIDRVKFEMLDLLVTEEKDVSTTLLILPFAFTLFEDFYAFSLRLEDEIMPKLERECRGPTIRDISMQNTSFGAPKSKSKLIKRVSFKARAVFTPPERLQYKCPHTPIQDKLTKASMDKTKPEIQLAFFHPTFAWADMEDINDPLNFEKRAPFPTINLLRAARIRQYADENKTVKIADCNSKTLKAEGGQTLAHKFEQIIRLALS